LCMTSRVAMAATHPEAMPRGYEVRMPARRFTPRMQEER
jgi:hypothetical protein